jgi:Fe2+ or Zn2+ uptake regulation protein
LGDDLGQSLANSGLKLTRHRRFVFDTVRDSHDHPTAEEVFHRTQKAMPEISFATVYNSLSILVECGLVRQVTLDRSPARFCANMRDHCHFYCDVCAEVTDLDLPQAAAATNLDLPSGFKISNYSLSLRGTCPKCGAKAGE